MDNHLDNLEAKVLEAVGLIKDLKAQNASLKGRCGELEASLRELESARGRLTSELESARDDADTLEAYEEKRKEIEDRVGGLLRQLEGLG